MSVYRKRLIVAACIVAVLLLGVGVSYLWTGNSQPLGESDPVTFPAIAASGPEIQHFLDGDFGLITKVESLPRPVLQTFTERDGSRRLMANPGKRFEAGDVILDASVPRKRLIFAGVSSTECFVHYEQGGRGHSFLLAFFRLTPNGKIQPVWRSYCDGPAANLQELRSKVLDSSCSQAPFRRR
jgi:hypothetical protein